MLVKLIVGAIVILICIIAVLCIGEPDDNMDFLDSDALSNAEFERLFILYVNKIDKRKPSWIDFSLRELKRNYRSYNDNPRALSTLELLKETSMGQHPEVADFLLTCSKYQKKGMI